VKETERAGSVFKNKKEVLGRRKANCTCQSFRIFSGGRSHCELELRRYSTVRARHQLYQQTVPLVSADTNSCISRQYQFINVRLTFLTQSFRMRPTLQGLPWFECDGRSKDEILIRLCVIDNLENLLCDFILVNRR
jgi:hypothetical protein